MNQYIFIDLERLTEKGPILYQVSTNTVNSAIQTYSKVNNFPLKEMMEAAENNTLYLYWVCFQGSTQGALTQMDLVDYLQNLDLEIFLEDPYKYITHLLENTRILLDGEPKIQDPNFLEYEITFTFFNYLLSYLLYHIPQKDNNHLIIRYYPFANILYIPEYDKEPKPDSPNLSRVYSLQYNSSITIHILIYKN